MLSDDCVFCDESRLPEARREKRDPYGVRYWVFEPLNPVTPGHLLVVPFLHVNDAGSNGFITAGAFHVASKIAAHLPEHSYNLITSAGTPATQSVFHLHVHVVPRRPDDGLHLPWTGQQR